MLKIKTPLVTCLLLILVMGGACGKKGGGEDTPVRPPSGAIIGITDVKQQRDNSGATTVFHFTVNVDNASSKAITFDYTTIDGTATSADYTPVSGTMTIAPEQRNISIDVSVRGDSLLEPDKTFYVQISNAVNARISGTGKATGTIICTNGTYSPIDGSGYEAPASYPGLNLTWSDEFDGQTLDVNSWNYDTGGGGWGNNELENYTNSDKNSFLTGGYLVIQARQEVAGANNYTSARLQTKGKREFKYGRMDIRAKLPKGQGIWPAIWMLGSNIATTPWPASGEIDIMELLGHQPNKVYGTMHWGDVGSPSSQAGSNYTLSGDDFSGEFHVFSIVWDATKIEWWVDDHKFFTGNKTDVTGNYPFDQPFFFILNVAVGGNWPGNPDGTTVFPQRMIVDYVRVYQ